MKANVYARLVCLLLLGAATSVSAQTSTVTIEPGEGGAATVVASKAVELTETDYPLEALLVNQEGKVTLEFSVDGVGHATNIRLLTSSGVTVLDQKAAQLAGTRWIFTPGASNAAARLSVDWKLPLQDAGDYAIPLPPLPADAIPPKAITSHAVVANDYPALSIRTKEYGFVAVRFLIKEDGAVGQVEVVQSSGVKRLDDAAVQMISARWKFEAAKFGGKTAEWWLPATMSFQIFPDMLDKKNLRCYPKPISGGEQVILSGTLMVSGRATPSYRTVMDRWTSVTSNGDVSDVLIATKAGLKKPTGTLLQLLKGNGYKKPGAANGCWYYDPVLVAQ